MSHQHPPRTAFAATERLPRTALSDAPVDAASFRRRLLPCAPERCGGTCCAEGASLNAEEARAVRQVVHRSAADLRRPVPDLPEPCVVREQGVHRTVRNPRPVHEQIAGYLEHLPAAACAVLMDDARCSVQVVAESQGRRSWAYKPLARWLHPISPSVEGNPLRGEEAGPHPGGFDSRTRCGRSEACGRPAHEVLRAELGLLGELLGRDLAAGAASERT